MIPFGVGFRSDDEALRHRVDALEGTVAEREAEVQRLRAELEASKKPSAPAPAETPASAKVSLGLWERMSAKRGDPAPDGDRWALSVAPPSRGTVLGILGLLVVAIGVPFLVDLQVDSSPKELVALALALGIVPLAALLYRSGVVVDRRARTVTVWRWFLLRWSRTLPLEGAKLVVEERHVSPENGDSYVMGHVFLGDQFLLRRREHHAEALARRLAQFADVPFAGTRPESIKRIERMAWMPLTLGVVGSIIFVVLFLIFN